jgi:phage-related protein
VGKAAVTMGRLIGAALLTPPVGVLAALVAIVAVLYLAWTNNWFDIQGKTEAVVGVLKGLLQGVIDALGAVIDWLKANWPLVAALLAGPFGPLILLATDAFGIRSALLGALQAILDWITTTFTDGWTLFKDTIVGIATAIKDGVVGAVTFMFDQIEQGIENNITFWTERWEELKGLVTDAANAIKDAAVEVFNLMFGQIETAINNNIIFWEGFASEVVGIIEGLATDVYDAAVGVGEAIANGIGDGISAALDVTGAVAQDIANAIKAIINKGIRAINQKIPDKINMPSPIPDIPLPPNPIPELAKGGIVRKPTLALVGEGGPEAVIPLSRGTQALGTSVTVNIGTYFGQGGIDQFGRDLDRWLRQNGQPGLIGVRRGAI